MIKPQVESCQKKKAATEGGQSNEGRKRLLLKEALNALPLYVLQRNTVNHQLWLAQYSKFARLTLTMAEMWLLRGPRCLRVHLRAQHDYAFQSSMLCHFQIDMQSWRNR